MIIRLGLLKIMILFYITINPEIGYSQIFSKIELSILDSLVFIGDSTTIYSHFQNKERTLRNYNLKSEYQIIFDEIRNGYLNSLKKSKSINILTEKEISDKVKHYLRFSKTFVVPAVDQYAQSLYDNFISEAQNRNYRIALKYYYIAENRKVIFIRSEKREINSRLQLISKYIKQGEYELAQNLVNEIQLSAKNLPLGQEIKEELGYLSNLINEKRSKEYLNNIINQKMSLHKKYSIGIYGSVKYYGSVLTEDQTWYYHSYTSDYKVPFQIDEIAHNFGYTLGVTIDRYITNRLKIGVGYYLGKQKIDILKKTTQFTSEVNLNHSAVFLGVEYIFTPTKVVRPYLGLGINHLQVERDKIELENNASSEPWARIYKKRFDLPQILQTIGIEYIPFSQNTFSIKVFFTVNYNLKNSIMIGKYGSTFGTKYSYLF